MFVLGPDRNQQLFQFPVTIAIKLCLFKTLACCINRATILALAHPKYAIFSEPVSLYSATAFTSTGLSGYMTNFRISPSVVSFCTSDACQLHPVLQL